MVQSIRKLPDGPLLLSPSQFQRAVSAVSNQAVFLLDSFGIISSWNKEACRITGYEEQEIVGNDCSVLYPADAIKGGSPRRELDTVRREGQLKHDVVRMRRDGTLYWAREVTTALRDETGTVVGFARVLRDLTEHRQHEEALWESEEHFRLLVESVRDYAIFLLDTEGHVVSWNSGAEAIKQYTADEIVGKHFSIFYPAEALERKWPSQELAFAERDGRFEDEGWRLRKDGSRFWANVVITALRDSEGQLAGYAKVTRDLTERKNVEEQLRRVNAELERRVNERTAELVKRNEALAIADRRKDEYLATLAHELRNPLAPIRTGLEVLRLAGNDERLRTETCAMMSKQMGQMIRLIDDLLDVSRLTSGKLRLRIEQTSLAAALQSAVEMIQPFIDEAAHSLTISMPPAELVLNADPVRLSQIFANLLSNAAKYTERGGNILVTVKRSGSEAIVCVRDSGIGISPEHLGNIFNMFSQVDSALDRSDGGLGIGLSLVRGLVEMHGGTIEARSEGLGKGSEFIVRFPLANADTVKGELSEAEDSRLPESKCRVLIIDDNKDAARMLATLLRAMGHEVDVAHNGLQALQMGEALLPNVVLLDIGMPKLNGYEVARRFRRQRWSNGMVLAAITGWGQEEDKRRAIEAGFDYHLTKPIEASQVERILEEATARQRTTDSERG